MDHTLLQQCLGVKAKIMVIMYFKYDLKHMNHQTSNIALQGKTDEWNMHYQTATEMATALAELWMTYANLLEVE